MWRRDWTRWPQKEDAMRHLRYAVLASLAIVLCAAPVAVAKKGSAKAGGAVAAPVHNIGGLTSSELFGEAWADLLSNPVGTFEGGCQSLGHKGKVQAPVPDADLTSTCTVKPGTPVLFFFGSECSNVEEPPFFGADAAAQRACALAADEAFFVSGSIAVDGGEPASIVNSRFELFSPQRTVELPPDNFLGVPPQTATFVAHGWAAIVQGLRPGHHVITVVVEDIEFGATTFEAIINVVPGTQ
jgi:hypothetical protein